MSRAEIVRIYGHPIEETSIFVEDSGTSGEDSEPFVDPEMAAKYGFRRGRLLNELCYEIEGRQLLLRFDAVYGGNKYSGSYSHEWLVSWDLR